MMAWIDRRSCTVSGNYAAHYHDPARRALLKPEAVWEIERGLALTGPQVFQAAQVRTAWYQELGRLFGEFDFLVMPTTQVFPFKAELHWPGQIAGSTMDTYHRWMESVVPATMGGLPTLGAPAGFSEAGLPAGIQIIGSPQADLAVLRIGHAYDLASGHARVKSPLLSNNATQS